MGRRSASNAVGTPVLASGCRRPSARRPRPRGTGSAPGRVEGSGKKLLLLRSQRAEETRGGLRITLANSFWNTSRERKAFCLLGRRTSPLSECGKRSPHAHGSAAGRRAPLSIGVSPGTMNSDRNSASGWPRAYSAENLGWHTSPLGAHLRPRCLTQPLLHTRLTADGVSGAPSTPRATPS